MKKKMGIFLLGVLLSLTVSCSFFASDQTEEISTSQAETETKQVAETQESAQESQENVSAVNGFYDPYAEIETQEESQNYEDEKGIDLLNMDYVYPVIAIPEQQEVEDIINQTIDAEKQDYFQKIENNLSIVEQLEKEGNELTEPYMFSSTYRTQRNDTSVLSFDYNIIEYKGGVHGTFEDVGITFDVETGQKLSFDDLSDNKEKFRSSCENELLRQCKNMPDGILSSKDQADIEKYVEDMISSDNWFFTKSGIKFVASSGEIADYETGFIPFTVPYQKLDGLKEKYLYYGNYQNEAMNGCSLEADLNGDGVQDQVVCDIDIDDETWDTDVTFTINGTDYSSAIDNTSAYYSENYSKVYCLSDLNQSDNYIEIAVSDSGENAYSSTDFFRYTGDSVENLGEVPGIMTYGECTTYGNGNIEANTPLSIFETAWSPMQYTLQNNTIKKIEDEWYTIYQYTGHENKKHTHQVLQNVVVYTQKDKQSQQYTLSSLDGEVVCPRTDNIHWVEVDTSDGAVYYLYVKEFSTIESGEKELDVSDVFSNMFLAG